jgi:hypothetical protein
LLSAQIWVSALDLKEILRQPIAEMAEGLSADLQRAVEEIEGQS